MDRIGTAGGTAEIRRYVPADAAALRRIAVATADAGGDGTALLPDAPLLADLLTRHTTDVEPQSCWVAVAGTEVVGYVAGRMGDAHAKRVSPGTWLRVLAAALRRGLPFRRWVPRLAFRNLALWARGGGRARADLRDYPAAVHINLVPGARGGGAGRALLERFLSAARAAGAKGVRANVREDNVRARAFFERHGFRVLDRYVAFSPAAAGAADRVTVVYGLRLGPGPEEANA